jgi:hypothetical protein
MAIIRFLHIPKTAGSTLNSILHRVYEGKNYFHFTGDLDKDKIKYLELTKNAHDHIHYYTGHAPIKTGLPDVDNAPAITFLREPVKRVMSFCQHVSEGKSPYLREKYPPKNFCLDEFLESGNHELSNLQTKMLINRMVHLGSSVQLEKMSGSEAIDKATQNLFHKISCFGIQEYFDESLILFSNRFKWKMPWYKNQNVKNNKKLIEFKDHHMKKITELNVLDLAVYRKAKDRFQKNLATGEYDRKKCLLFQKLNGYYPVAKNFMQRSLRLKELLVKKLITDLNK